MKKIFICIPTYNEAENIISLLDQIKTQKSSFENTYELEVVVIDDNSPDGTAKLVKDYDKNHSDFKVHIIENEKKSGLGKAYIQAFKFGIEKKAFAVIEMDADFSHHPIYLPKIIEKLSDYDLVIGSRYVPGAGIQDWGIKRRFISWFGNTYSRAILWKNVHDFTGGFNAYKTKVFTSENGVDLDSIDSNGYSFQIEMKYKAIKKGFTFTEVPITFQDRTYGSSKFGKEIVLEAIKKPWQLRFGQ